MRFLFVWDSTNLKFKKRQKGWVRAKIFSTFESNRTELSHSPLQSLPVVEHYSESRPIFLWVSRDLQVECLVSWVQVLLNEMYQRGQISNTFKQQMNFRMTEEVMKFVTWKSRCLLWSNNVFLCTTLDDFSCSFNSLGGWLFLFFL